MSQGVLYVEHGPAEANHPDSISVNEPSSNKIVNCTLINSHLARGFLGAFYVLRVFTRRGRTANLKDDHTFGCECRRCKCTAPGTINPKPVLPEAMCLDNQRVSR